MKQHKGAAGGTVPVREAVPAGAFSYVELFSSSTAAAYPALSAPNAHTAQFRAVIIDGPCRYGPSSAGGHQRSHWANRGRELTPGGH